MCQCLEKICFNRRPVSVNNCQMSYSTRKIVLVKYKATVVEIEKFFLNLPVFLAEIRDECIYGLSEES